MKKVHISFANESFKKSIDLLKQTSIDVGRVDEFIEYTQGWLKTTEFWKKNAFILNQPRGCGFWIWKPYIILKTMETLSSGDIVMYSDAGLKVIDNLDPLFKIAAESSLGSRMVFLLPHIGVIHQNKMWTKKDCFVLAGCDEPKYHNGFSVNGAISLWKKTEENTQILNEWMKLLRDPRISTDSLNMCGSNFIEFRDHRHDQSVLSLLSIKYDFEVFRDPTQYGNEEINKFVNSPYKQLFQHHRNFKHMQ
jgi:hypothetical protein